jgi:hypothetical protein
MRINRTKTPTTCPYCHEIIGVGELGVTTSWTASCVRRLHAACARKLRRERRAMSDRQRGASA